MAEQRGNQHQNRGVTFMNVCSSHAGFSTDDESHSVVAKEKQAYLDLVRRQVDQLHHRAGGSSGYQPYSRNNPNQQSGGSRWGHRPGFCPDDSNKSNTNLGYDPYSFTDWNKGNRDPWNVRPDGPCPDDVMKTGQSFPNPCTDRPDKSHSKNTVLLKGNQSRPYESRSTVNLGTLPWNPSASPSGAPINCNARDDCPGARNRGKQDLLQQELRKAQSYCKRGPGSSPSATDICLGSSRGRLRTPDVSLGNLYPRSSNRARSLVKLLMIILVAICLILLLAFLAYQLCTLMGFCGGGCKLEKTIHYVPY